jgi:hypothetical protein
MSLAGRDPDSDSDLSMIDPSDAPLAALRQERVAVLEHRHLDAKINGSARFPGKHRRRQR